ncbi:hypothetical protein PAP_09650 [Palaeococcus pacificus DY20341]|uniref:VanZ-like domain-containing protein n=1 Tax=Palaeococcus pacificus DY20341 TaxID=1343739 RepID=A0A075LUB3_9EURY|nr:VanZ family protein [Palaeococcus pacificus]AIF70305.1 hypothetical protein PAP_09650 [Palaeococcus pacificus DY20341]
MKRRFLFFYVLLLFVLNLSPKVPTSPIPNGDKLVHFLEFALLGVLADGSAKYLLGLPFLLEFLQLFVPGRVFSTGDMMANLIGFTCGYLAWRVWNEGGN